MSLGHVRASGSVHGNFHSSWTIPGFSELDCKKGQKIQSEYFRCQENSSRWNLSIYPRGDLDGRDGSVSCFLNLHPVDNNGDEFIEMSSFSFRDTSGNVLWESKSYNWNKIKPGEGSGYGQPMKREELINKLIDDTLIISVNVKYCRTFIKDGGNDEYTAEMSPIIQLVEDFESLFNRAWGLSRKRTDCVMVVGIHKIPVHCAVLSARSKVFKEIFDNYTKKTKSHRIEITDFAKNIIDPMIEFIYTGNVKEMSIDVAMELLRASDKYQMDDMKLYCTNYLLARLDDGNVGDILVKADACSATKLRTRSMEYFCACCDRQLLEKHRAMLEKHPALLVDIFGLYADAKA